MKSIFIHNNKGVDYSIQPFLTLYVCDKMNCSHDCRPASTKNKSFVGYRKNGQILNIFLTDVVDLCRELFVLFRFTQPSIRKVQTSTWVSDFLQLVFFH